MNGHGECALSIVQALCILNYRERALCMILHWLLTALAQK